MELYFGVRNAIIITDISYKKTVQHSKLDLLKSQLDSKNQFLDIEMTK